MKTAKNTLMKKASLLMLLALAAALVFSACGSTEPAPTEAPTAAPTEAPTPEPTAAPTEAPTDAPVAPEATDAPSAGLPSNVDGLASADEVTALLDAAYAGVGAENLPMMLMHMPLDLADMDGVTYHTGLTSLDGIDGIVVSESGVGSIAYSLVYIMTADGADADAIQADLMEKINPSKWICVTAEKIVSVRLGSDVMLVMGAPETADSVYDAVLEAADGVFTSVGEKVVK